MGLASKLAASHGPPSGYPSQQQTYQQPPPQGRPGGYPGQPQYQSYSQPYPGPQQYGAPPQSQGMQYGAPPQGYGQPPNPAAEVASYRTKLQQAVQEKHLESFPIARELDRIASTAPMIVNQYCQQFNIPKEIASDLVRLALYDIIIFIDDSGSMSFEENGERIKDLDLILKSTTAAATKFDDDGIEIRFMNDEQTPAQNLNNIRTEAQVMGLMYGRKYKGLTPLGTRLRERVVDSIIIPRLRSRQAKKPVMVVVITDGAPAGEHQSATLETLRYVHSEAQRSGYGSNGIGPVAFQFAQVGNDAPATAFLATLDKDPQVKDIVDCTSNFENESAEMANGNPPVDLTPHTWLVKLLLGAIDPSYDRKDESGSAPGPGTQGRPPQQYGQQPPYPSQAHPPQGQYGQPPQGQYSQSQQYYGQPPAPYPQGQGYGPPGQQYGQPAPQGQYGQPPPQGQYGGRPPQPPYPGRPY